MKVRKKIAIMAVGISTLAFSFTGAAWAHVVVRPSDAKTGTYQTFTVSVPTERDNATVSVRLDMPMDITSVTPTVKPGWTIQTNKQGEGESAVTTTVTWAGGRIEPGYRDEFTFSAKTPDHPMDLQWKAYQTYQDGTVVSWDQAAVSDTDDEDATTGPFSVTKVAADSDQDIAIKNADTKAANAQQTAEGTLYVSIGGAVLALFAIIIAIIAIRKTIVKV